MFREKGKHYKTTVEVISVRAFPDDKHLFGHREEMGQQIGKFKTMMRELHRAGIEVILHVVCNHPSEGNQMGPTHEILPADAGQPRYYMDHTGTGNTFIRHPR